LQKPTPLIGLTGIHARRKNACATWNIYADKTMDLELPKDFKEFLRLLRAHGVEYLLIGGWAVGYHGYPRSTDDLDVWIAITPANADRVVKALSDFGFDVPELSADLFLQDDQIVRMGVEPVRIEVMTTISGVNFSDCYRERLETALDDEPVSLINLQHLRINKEASGRLKDLSDLENLPES
jgi:hypothetical protein